MSDSTTTRQILELLRHKHSPSDGWAAFAELRKQTGYGGQAADFYAFHTWPSKNFWRVAYEIKASRADFARELKYPHKRAWLEGLANECWFAMPCGLVKPDEIPEGWGLLEMTKGGLRAKKRAQQREVDEPPIAFVASLLRRGSDNEPTIPRGFWLRAGQEITDEDIDEITESRFQTRLESLQLELRYVKREVRDDEPCRLAGRVVLDVLGYDFIADREKLRAFLETLEKPKPPLVDLALVGMLKRLRTAIEKVIERAERDDY